MRNFIKSKLSQKQKKYIKRRIKKFYLRMRRNVEQVYSFQSVSFVDVIISRLLTKNIFISVFYRLPRFCYVNLLISFVFPITGMSIYACLHQRDPFRRPYSNFLVSFGLKYYNVIFLPQKNNVVVERAKYAISNVRDLEYLFVSYLQALEKAKPQWAQFFRQQLLRCLAKPEFYSQEQLYNCFLRLSVALPDFEMDIFKSELPASVLDNYFFYLGEAYSVDHLFEKELSKNILSLDNVLCVAGYKFYKNKLLLDIKIENSMLDEYTFGDIVSLSAKKYFVFVKSPKDEFVELDRALLVPEVRQGFFYFFLDRITRIIGFEQSNDGGKTPILLQNKLDWEVKNALKDSFFKREVLQYPAYGRVLVKQAHFVIQKDYEHRSGDQFNISLSSRGYLLQKLFERHDLKEKYFGKKVGLSFSARDNFAIDSALDALTKQGFEFVDDSLLSLAERMAIFFYSSIVFMPFGSQLSLVSFLGNETKLAVCLNDKDIETFNKSFQFFGDHFCQIQIVTFENLDGALEGISTKSLPRKNGGEVYA